MANVAPFSCPAVDDDVAVRLRPTRVRVEPVVGQRRRHDEAVVRVGVEELPHRVALLVVVRVARVEPDPRDAFEAGFAGYEVVIDRVFSGLDATQDAHDYMESNANVGKIVVTLA